VKPEEVKALKRRITKAIAKELGGTAKGPDFSKHSKSPDYSLYGRDHFIKDAPK